MYSILPCPYGWSLSASLYAILKPISDTSDEPASERLLNASAVIEIAPEMVPAMNFPVKRHIFKNMPTIPVRVPYLRLTLSSL